MVGMTRVSLISCSIYLQRTHPKHRLTAEEAETYVNVRGNVLLPFMTSSLTSSHLLILLPHLLSSPPSSPSPPPSHLLTLLPHLLSSPLIFPHLLPHLLSPPHSPPSSPLISSHLLTHLLPHLPPPSPPPSSPPPQRVLAHPKCWAVQATALLLRSQLERERRRTVERAMTQLQVLSLTLLSSRQLLNC